MVTTPLHFCRKHFYPPEGSYSKRIQRNLQRSYSTITCEGNSGQDEEDNIYENYESLSEYAAIDPFQKYFTS